MNNKIPYFTLLLAAALALTSSCEKDELAFDIVESPVLAVFEDMEAPPGEIKVRATFYDLDKSGILDQDIGIDSLPVANLNVSVFVFGDQLVGEYETDGNGTVLFEEPMDALDGAGRLEWVGTYEDTPFRIYKNY